MTWWTGLAPWELGFPFPGSRISTFLAQKQTHPCQPWQTMAVLKYLRVPRASLFWCFLRWGSLHSRVETEMQEQSVCRGWDGFLRAVALWLAVQLSHLKDRAFAGAVVPRDEVNPDVV